MALSFCLMIRLLFYIKHDMLLQKHFNKKRTSFGKTKLCFHCSLFGFFKMFINTQRVEKSQFSSPQPSKNQVKKLWESITLTKSSSFSDKVLHELEHRVNTGPRINEPGFHVRVCLLSQHQQHNILTKRNL